MLINEQKTVALKAVTKEFKEGGKAIHSRQKLMFTADCSELGCQVVEAYESDEFV